MSTRSFIGIMNPDGTVTGVYCQSDGYPTGVGALLNKHYATPDALRDLLALGDLSFLDTTTETTNAYCRDRGESMEEPIFFASLDTVGVENDHMFEWFYVFTPKGWLHAPSNTLKFTPLSV